MTSNRLSEQASPYLLLHANNPVHWQPWDDQALQLAQQSKKPILLSIGYSACHWCHVMAQESFEDSTIAEVMNNLFINIKVDREERPDLDTIYQTALANMGQQRGWPLTMFLNSNGEPYAGGTYFPPTAQHGLPSFTEVMYAAAETFANDPEKPKINTEKLIAKLSHNQNEKGEISITLLNHAASQLLDGVDIVYGGLGMDAKFPQPMFQELLWRAYCRTAHNSYRDAVENTLNHMCQGGIYDHLGGGFARYTTDDRWLIPHFEKMLYDNALIISLLILVWQKSHSKLYLNCIKETVDWLLTDMQTSEGAFASSISADSEGHGEIESGEGAFYVWHKSDIDYALGKDADVFKSIFDVSQEGNWEGVNILNRSDAPLSQDPETEKHICALKEKLRLIRNKRPHPEIDDKILIDWNGLAIAALVEASLTFSAPTWLDAACKAYECIIDTLGEDTDHLYHSYRQSQHSPIAILDDYANMSHAALRLFEATCDFRYLNQAQNWVTVLNQNYWDNKDGGYFYTADTDDSVIVRTKTAMETATPAGNSMMVSVLSRLYGLTGEVKFLNQAETIISTFSMEAASNFLGMASMLNYCEMVHDLIQIVIVGNADDPQTQHLLNCVYEVSMPNRLLQIVPPDTELPSQHPASGKTQQNEKPTAYICRGRNCRLPITDSVDLKHALHHEAYEFHNVN